MINFFKDILSARSVIIRLLPRSIYIKMCIIIFLSCGVSFSQLKISAGGGYQIHLEGGTNQISEIPVEYQNVIEYPSIGKFFDNSFYYMAGASYRFSIKDMTDYLLILGFEFKSAVISNSYSASELILGEDLNINSFCPSLGLGLFTSENVFVYGSAGISVKTYEGSFSVDNIKVTEEYKPRAWLELNSGIDIERIGELPLVLRLGIGIDIGSTKRGNVLFYENDELVAHAHPTGDLTLSDNTISLKISLGYLIDF